MKTRFYVITYDLKNEDKDYMPLYDAIKSLGKWEHPIASTWIVNTSMNAEEISRKLHSDNIMSDNDILFVCQLKIGDRNGWMGKSVWDWIRKIEESESEVSRENLCSYIKDEPNRIVEVDDRYADLKLSSATLCTEKNAKTETETESETEIESETETETESETESETETETEIESEVDVRYVDLGLPSGTLWADRNVGAETIKDNGGYFIFSEAKKQGNVPTNSQFRELIDECKWTWKGKGYEVTGKNGNSIYLPAAGYSNDSCVCDIYRRGYYWSSSANNSDYCYYLYFHCKNIGIDNDNIYSIFGQSIRLVK